MPKIAAFAPSKIASHKNPKSFFLAPATTYSHFSRPAAHASGKLTP
jgi:hypothetical protein